MAKPGVKGLRRLWFATHYSLKGLRSCWRAEASFRQEVLACLMLVPVGLWLGQDGVEKVLLAGSCFLVLIVELLNSSIEAAVDRFGDEYHVLSGQAKDIGSAAVMISLVLLALVWALVLVY